MFGLIVKFVAHDGQRDIVIRKMSTGMQNMPGCRSYILAKDPADEVSIWITEVWENAESKEAANLLPLIQAVIDEVKPMLARCDSRIITTPVGGQGL